MTMILVKAHASRQSLLILAIFCSPVCSYRIMSVDWFCTASKKVARGISPSTRILRGTVVIVGPSMSDIPWMGALRPVCTTPNSESGAPVYRARTRPHAALRMVAVVHGEAGFLTNGTLMVMVPSRMALNATEGSRGNAWVSRPSNCVSQNRLASAGSVFCKCSMKRLYGGILASEDWGETPRYASWTRLMMSCLDQPS